MSNKTKILIVDDEKNILTLLKKTLDHMDYDVSTAEDGNKALTHLQKEDYDILFLDLNLPDITGMEILQRLSRQQQKPDIVIITAFGNIDNAVEAMKLGAVDFIQKPFTPDQIRSTVLKLIERRNFALNDTSNYDQSIEMAKKLMKDGLYKQAGDYAQKAIDFMPSNPEGYNYLGAILEIRGDLKNAIEAYQTACHIDPKYEPARKNLESITKLHRNRDIELDMSKLK
ncbi:MAG TPA: response regulator [Candidatus Cloacimonadota bacterium]|nr:response regulator [Candidatus Cloacimonadota bacterium]HPT70989.1 response regulator [Candidatus Cloacimonadota bacterium]